jgi:hypothetical protein
MVGRQECRRSEHVSFDSHVPRANSTYVRRVSEQGYYCTHETFIDTGNSVAVKTHGTNNSELLL